MDRNRHEDRISEGLMWRYDKSGMRNIFSRQVRRRVRDMRPHGMERLD